MSENQKGLKDWIVLSTTMIGIVLTLLALIWQSIARSGIVVTTFLLMIAFILLLTQSLLIQKRILK